ncbi:probable crossover junction endonuclease EME2 isoform X2 [Tursiops truncatus]|uniref:Probable crossover junction endonuclease EME2 isoform X2 n=1 Tax=Tursiops truncatus TaxID=9739 RepID=A0A6J3Q0W9_TURTR|nr:probable crossover junction endonuclease EME2 isoform X2 [Tursiops truncatus]
MDPAILEDAGADILMEALDALSCECRVEPERPAWSLGWSRVKPDPCSLSVPPEVWAADEQDRLLLLEPEEFLQGVVQLTQVLPVQYPGGMAARASSGDSCLGGSWLARGGGGPGASAALGKRGCAVGGLLVGAESACVCLHQGPHPASLQAVPGVAPPRAGQQPRRVARDGTGLRGACWQQIRQFNCVSPAVANAVVAAFPSPCLLQQPQTRGTAADNMQSKLRKTQGRRRQQEEPTSHEAVLLTGSRPASQACSLSPDMLGQQLPRDFPEKESGCSHTRHRKQTD